MKLTKVLSGIHGSRTLLSVHKNDDPDEDWVYAYFDFADARDLAFLDARQTGTALMGPMARSGTMRVNYTKDPSGSRGTFKEPLQTFLPYHSTELTWARRSLADDEWHMDDDELLLDDERLVRKVHLVRFTG